MINHLWQSSGFALLVALLALVLRKSPAKVRYWVWLSASLKFLVPLTLLMSAGSLIPRPEPRVAPATPTILRIAVPFTPDLYSSATAQPTTRWVPIAIGILWALGFIAIIAARCRAWLRIRAVLRCAKPIDLDIPIQAVVAEHGSEPGIVGLLSPVLVLPPQLIETLNPTQLNAVIAHEMCHVRRRDNFFAAVHMAVEAIFWFHPFVWWIGSRLVEERERACDEEVMRMGCEPADYVESILKVCRLYRESPLACVSGVTGADVKKRLRTILSGSIVRDWNTGKKLALMAAGLAALAIPVVIGILNAPAIRAQNAPAVTPQFEVASIRPCEQGHGPVMINVLAGKFSVHCYSLPALIAAAYVIHAEPGTGAIFARDAVSGGPAWARSEYYDVEAQAEGNPATAIVLGPMLRALLKDRFRLKLHSETRQIPVYELSVAKKGLRVQPLKDGSCTPVDEFNPGPVPVDQQCNRALGNNLRGHLNVHAANPDQLAERLSGMFAIDRPVVNRTGVAGMFDVHLEFTSEGPGHSFTGDPAAEPTAAPSGGPSIFTALEEQLGLKLVPAKGPGEFLVIDHVERPTEN